MTELELASKRLEGFNLIVEQANNLLSSSKNSDRLRAAQMLRDVAAAIAQESENSLWDEEESAQILGVSKKCHEMSAAVYDMEAPAGETKYKIFGFLTGLLLGRKLF
jgi:hypothetical protein